MNEYRQYTSDQVVLNYLASAMATREEVIRAGLNEMIRLGGSLLNYVENILGFGKEKIQYVRKLYLK